MLFFCINTKNQFIGEGDASPIPRNPFLGRVMSSFAPKNIFLFYSKNSLKSLNIAKQIKKVKLENYTVIAICRAQLVNDLVILNCFI